MAGTIPLSMTQQFNELGEPLGGGLLYIYQAGTVATPQNAYQDLGLTPSLVMPNPIVLDAAGRVPQFFLADGQIKIRLTDSSGVTQLARDGILVIGASSGGGGGGSVDPTTVLQTGMVSIFYGTGSVTGFVRANGLSIGNSSSGATEANGNQCQALFSFLYNADANLRLRNSSGTVIPRTGADSTASGAFTGSRQLDLPDLRGRGIAGLDDMGNSAAGRLTATYFAGQNPSGGAVASTVLGAASSGLESRTLASANLPPYTPAGTITNGAISFLTAAIANAAVGGNAAVATGTLVANTNLTTALGATQATSTFAGTAAAGQNSTPLSIIQPTMLTTIYLKL